MLQKKIYLNFNKYCDVLYLCVCLSSISFLVYIMFGQGQRGVDCAP